MRRANPLTWFLLSAVWAAAGVINLLDGRSPWAIAFDFLAAFGFTVLAVGQICCDRRAEAGRKPMLILMITVTAVLLLFALAVILLT